MHREFIFLVFCLTKVISFLLRIDEVLFQMEIVASNQQLRLVANLFSVPFSSNCCNFWNCGSWASYNNAIANQGCALLLS